MIKRNYITFFKIREKIRLSKNKTKKFEGNKIIISSTIILTIYCISNIFFQIKNLEINNIFNQPIQYSDYNFDFN